MSEQDNGLIPSLPRPTTANRKDWITYWKQQGQPWRTEPEIDGKRQEELAQHRSIVPDVKKGIYPFKSMKLSRADIEWLLATHENGRGPIDWSDESQRKRKGLNLYGADLEGVDLSRLPLAKMTATGDLHSLRRDVLADATIINLARADLRETHLEGTLLGGARLVGADLGKAYLEKAFLIGAHLEGAILSEAHLEDALLNLAHLEGALLLRARLGGANLFNAFFDSETRLDGVILFDKELGGVMLADVHWNEVNAAVVDWSALSILGNERIAVEQENDHKHPLEKELPDRFLDAARAYRQLSIVLRNQGLNEDAARFAYRAQLMQRKVLWYKHKFGQYFFSLFLDLITGYGYRPVRSFITYVIVISVFAFIYFELGPHLAWNEAIVISMTAFHGRGFFPTQFQPGDPQALVAAIEAFVGLLIEVTFIATLTQRLFGK